MSLNITRAFSSVPNKFIYSSDLKTIFKDEDTTRCYKFSAKQHKCFDQDKVHQFLSERYLVHLLGDSFLENTSHVGWYNDDALIHMIQVLEENNVFKEVDGIVEKFKECLKWQSKILSELSDIKADKAKSNSSYDLKVALELSCEVQSLAVGQKILFPGGSKEHSVLYEVQRVSNDDFSFHIYNTGDGISEHWMLIEDGSLKIKGVYEIEKISLEKISDVDFFQALLNLKLVSDENFAQNLYQGILSTLGGYKKEIPTNPSDYMQSQRAGTCVWKMLCAYLRYNLPLINYKYLKLKARLDVFEKWYDLGNLLDCKSLNKRLLSKFIVNEKSMQDPSAREKINLTKEELLAFGILKVQKSFNKYKYLLQPHEIEKAEIWYRAFTNESIYDCNNEAITEA